MPDLKGKGRIQRRLYGNLVLVFQVHIPALRNPRNKKYSSKHMKINFIHTRNWLRRLSQTSLSQATDSSSSCKSLVSPSSGRCFTKVLWELTRRHPSKVPIKSTGSSQFRRAVVPLWGTPDYQASNHMISLDWKTEMVVPIIKKGPRVCYRIVTHLSLPEKVYARVLERRFHLIADSGGTMLGASRPWNSRPALCFCTALWGDLGMCFPVYMCFVDLENAYDHLSQHLFWELLQEYGVYQPMLCISQSPYECSESCVSILGINVELVYGSTPLYGFQGQNAVNAREVSSMEVPV